MSAMPSRQAARMNSPVTLRAVDRSPGLKAGKDAAHDVTEATVPDTLANALTETRQRPRATVTRQRQLRGRETSSLRVADEEPSALARSVTTVADRLPPVGAVLMDWEQTVALLQGAGAGADQLRQLQGALADIGILSAFGTHVVLFARDAR